MSLFDSVQSLIGGQGGEEATMASHAMSLINDPATGGFDGLMQKFHEQGLGSVVNSWVGPGSNHPITADQVESVVGQDHINELASKLGVSPEEANAKIAEYLPTLMGKLAPAQG